ncbi:MAG: phosphoadenylyl-sulfate reductase, partial [Bryobacterales bacterium]|nr:phosphoadenylyl-sulfate reductase [Bryobacterales bacterium]
MTRLIAWKNMASQAARLGELETYKAAELVEWALRTYGRRFAISTSFQAEGMVLVDMAARMDSSVRVLTLDTGRLPEETHQMIDIVRERYGVRVEVVYPDAGEVERMTTLHGVNLFYRDPSLRKLCCQVRKVRPLDRKLKELSAWAVGLRREQSEERAATAKVEIVGERLKLSPLADWTAAQVEEYLTKHEVPRHALYARGYPSIGCAPCTRPVQPGEPERAGRWWWEENMSKECGLHVTPEGKLRQ